MEQLGPWRPGLEFIKAPEVGRSNQFCVLVMFHRVKYWIGTDQRLQSGVSTVGLTDTSRRRECYVMPTVTWTWTWYNVCWRMAPTWLADVGLTLCQRRFVYRHRRRHTRSKYPWASADGRGQGTREGSYLSWLPLPAKYSFLPIKPQKILPPLGNW